MLDLKRIKTLYMSDLINYIDEMDLSRITHDDVSALIQRFSHVHMTVKPDENRISFDELVTILRIIMIKFPYYGDFAFRTAEAIITSIVNHDDFESVIMLSYIPEDEIAALIVLLTPISYIQDNPESDVRGSWFREYGERFYKTFLGSVINTEYFDNFVTTFDRVFSLYWLSRKVYQIDEVHERWHDALVRNHIGAGVTFPDVVKIACFVWDTFSNVESRMSLFQTCCGRIRQKDSFDNDLHYVIQNHVDNIFGLIRKTFLISDPEYVFNSLGKVIYTLYLDNDTSLFHDVIFEMLSLLENGGNTKYDAESILKKISGGIYKIQRMENALSNKHDIQYMMDCISQVTHEWRNNPDQVSIYRDILNSPPNIDNDPDKEIENPITVLMKIPSIMDLQPGIAMEAVHKDSAKMNTAEKKIYKAYRTYKSAEEKVDSQLTKAAKTAGKMVIGDVRKEVIEGKQYTVIGILKKALGTVALFSTGKIKGIIALVVRHALRKKCTQSERRKIIMELETEIDLITEKIDDARGDNNRQAKYAMMRTKKDLENALKRIQYGMEADQGSISGAKAALNEARK